MHVVATVSAATLGAGVGMLLPLPTYRLSVSGDSAPAADCPHCQTPLPAGLRGWIGRTTCSSCGIPVTASPWGYVAVTALAFALLGWRLPHRSPAEVLLLAAWLVLAAAGIWLAAIDLHVRRLPRKVITAAAAVCGSLILAAAVVSGRPGLAATAGIAAVVSGLANLVPALVAPRQLGMGDVRLSALCGLLLGTHGWATVALGAALPWVLAAIVAAALLATRRVRGDTLIPLGPYLIAGTLATAIVAASG
ncbi:prepilin peptidase [Actinoplanes sp. NPDC049668]|uniref:prepilin peptidase n=1 Tax=unclassified Actinoplanes TaxID=2626549 RepID=UPI0033A1EF74